LALKSNHLNQRDDIFYLTIQEWFQGNEENWKDIVSSRKHEYDKHSQDRYPRSFASTPSAEPPEYKANPLSEGYGKGQIVFPGFIEGKILVMKEYQPGPWPDFDILIAKHTDPGWSLLISKSKGLVVEQGGLLSHASIVTRELGIPCVIGVKEATDRFKNESNAVLDASNGTIEIKNQK
jgi:pyruvate,water dikinase